MPIPTDIWAHILQGKIVFVGIGNPLRGDDGFGPHLIEQISGQVRAACIDAGSAPESYAGKIAKEKPDTIVLVDAVYLNQPAGGSALLTKDDILQSGFTTHDISPYLFIEYLEHETKANIYLLGVQPQNVEFGSEMSDEVKKTSEALAEQIKEILHA